MFKTLEWAGGMLSVEQLQINKIHSNLPNAFSATVWRPLFFRELFAFELVAHHFILRCHFGLCGLSNQHHRLRRLHHLQHQHHLQDLNKKEVSKVV